MNDDSVTVLIAAYNAESFIERAIRSALEQTYRVLEIIIVDDASTDGTAAFVRKLSSEDGRIKLISLALNGGPSVARNAGLDAAMGDWVAILDADDAFMPARIENMLQAGKDADIVLDNISYYNVQSRETSPPSLTVTPGTEKIDAVTFVERARPYNEEVDYGLLKPLLRRSFLNRNHLRYPVFSCHGEDFLFTVYILLKGANCLLSRKPGYIYTDRSSGFSRTKVDYVAMQRHSLDLLKMERVRDDKPLVNALLERVERLKKLSRQYSYHHNMQNFRLFSKNRDYVFFAKCFLTSAVFRKVTVDIIRDRIKMAGLS